MSLAMDFLPVAEWVWIIVDAGTIKEDRAARELSWPGN
jgi:hypothetical protein